MLRIDFETPPSHEVLLSKLADFESLVEHIDLVIFSDYGKGGLKHIPRMIELGREGVALIEVVDGKNNLLKVVVPEVVPEA